MVLVNRLGLGDWLAGGALLGVVGAVLLYAGRGTSFTLDEWTFLFYRRSGGVPAALTKYNGQLSAVVVEVYRALGAIVGFRQYWPYRVTGVAVYLLVGGLVFVYARRRLPLVAAVALTTLSLAVARAVHAMLWPLATLTFGVPLAAFIACLLLLDRPSRHRDGAICGLLLVAVATSGVGLVVTASVGLELVAHRAGWRRIWAAAVPAAAYGLWFVTYRGSTTFATQVARMRGGDPQQATGPDRVRFARLSTLPHYLFDAVRHTLGAVSGLRVSWSGLETVLFVGALIAAVLVARAGLASVRLVVLGATLVGFWAEAGLAALKASQQYPSRYFFPAGVLTVLLVIELCGQLRPVVTAQRAALVLIAVVTAAAVVGDAQQVYRSAQSIRAMSRPTPARLAALELARPRVDPAFEVDGDAGPLFVRGGPYFAAIDDLGSPAETIAQLRRDTQKDRGEADAVLVRALGLHIDRNGMLDGTGIAPTLDRGGDGATTTAHCVVVAPTPGGAVVDVTVPPTGITIRPNATTRAAVALRRFGTSFTGPPVGDVDSDAGTLDIPPDHVAVSWHAQIRFDSGGTVCGR